MKKINSLFIMAIATIFVACEGSKPARVIDNFEIAVEQHQEGDSSMLIGLIILCVILLCIYIKKWMDKK